MHRIVRPIAFALILLGLALVPVFVTDAYIRHLFIISFIYAIVASNWDLTLGYCGIFNFGHLTFFGIGVYTTAILSKLLGVDPWLAIPAAALPAVIAAVIVAAPVVRLSGIYVVLVTFAFGQLVLQFILSQSGITGGASGIVRIPGLEIPAPVIQFVTGDPEARAYRFIRDYKLGYYYVGLSLLVASTVFLRLVVNSPFGRSIEALRDNEEYARARGISIARQRMMTLAASAIFTAVAGGFYAIYLRVASPEVFGFSTLTLALSMVLVGGIATTYGPIIAAIVLTGVLEGLTLVEPMNQGEAFAPLVAVNNLLAEQEMRFLLIAVAMVAVLAIAPRGLSVLVGRLRP